MPSGIEAGQAAQTGIPEKKRRKEAKPSPGSFQIHNAITGSWPKGNLQVFKEASKNKETRPKEAWQFDSLDESSWPTSECCPRRVF
ncbi:hypothetical protein T4E_4804 [Trichinella pseudospiralis]|uniref:Uncharacterized protein n=1 Tax=Trichinella pseudospiralis TaxID=6337 RepID=A0A0V0XDL7_TRIPS|nr:hypothetical protein T4E_4804 [Trichinella pseudospiralis]